VVSVSQIQLGFVGPIWITLPHQSIECEPIEFDR